MKKILSICLLFSMILASVPTTVLAAENKMNPERDKNLVYSEDISTYNRDIWSTNGLPQYIDADGKTIQVNPGPGKNLKVHFYLSKIFANKINLQILVDTGSGYRTVAHWNTEGDHWADVVTNTSNKIYKIRIIGPAYINGAFYTEP